MKPRRVLILGSTGSIGRQTLEVIDHLNRLAVARGEPPRFTVAGLAAGSNAASLAEQMRRFRCTKAALCRGDATHPELRSALRGPAAAVELVSTVDADIVVAAMVGAAGIPATLAALERGCDVALANKETLVAAGALVMRTIANAAKPARIFPVDSEHAGVWQCLIGASRHAMAACVPPITAGDHIARVTLTASGGPFRTWSRDAIHHATPAQALQHPTWTMGGKVTIDSASLMNKCLELIEAHWLFGLKVEQLDAVIHPQSVVHALVETLDGSVLAQCGTPDMRTPIQLALLHPHRAPGLARRVNLAELATLSFEAVDCERFPAMNLWKQCIGPGRSDTTRGAILNAANEIAIARFLDESKPPLPFGRITELAASALATQHARPIHTLSDVLEADQATRHAVRERL